MRFPAPKNDFIPARGSEYKPRMRPFLPTACFADQPYFSPLANGWLDPVLEKEVTAYEPDL